MINKGLTPDAITRLLNFQDYFVNAMAFPNKQDPFPELAKEVALPKPKEIASASDSRDLRRRRRKR